MVLTDLRLGCPVPTVLYSGTHRNDGCSDVAERYLLAF